MPEYGNLCKVQTLRAAIAAPPVDAAAEALTEVYTAGRRLAQDAYTSRFSQDGQKPAAAAGEGDQNASAALTAPEPGEAVLEQAALEELPQDPLAHRPQRAVAPGEALRPDPQQLLEMALDELVERGLTGTPRPVDPASDLHAQPEAGGRVAGGKGGRLRRSRSGSRQARICSRPGHLSVSRC